MDRQADELRIKEAPFYRLGTELKNYQLSINQTQRFRLNEVYVDAIGNQSKQIILEEYHTD